MRWRGRQPQADVAEAGHKGRREVQGECLFRHTTALHHVTRTTQLWPGHLPCSGSRLQNCCPVCMCKVWSDIAHGGHMQVSKCTQSHVVFNFSLCCHHRLLSHLAATAQVFNEIGESECSPAVAFATAASVPDPPLGLAVVDSTTTSIAVHWQVGLQSLATSFGFPHRLGSADQALQWWIPPQTPPQCTGRWVHKPRNPFSVKYLL